MKHSTHAWLCGTGAYSAGRVHVPLHAATHVNCPIYSSKRPLFQGSNSDRRSRDTSKYYTIIHCGCDSRQAWRMRGSAARGHYGV